MADGKESAPNRECLERLPVTASKIVQLDPGDLGLARIEVRGRNSVILRLRTGARSIWTTVPEEDWIGYTVPIAWQGDYLLNGMSATRKTVFRLDGGTEFDVLAESRDFITVGIRRSVLARTISSLIGRDFAIAVDTHRHLQVPKAHRQRLLAILWKAIAGASTSRSATTFYRLPRSIEVALIEAVADWTVEAGHPTLNAPVNRKSEMKIVRASIRKVTEADHALLTISDLCHAAGVGKSRLHQAFCEIYGISPGAYLHRLRLTSIRRELLSEEDSPRSVKDVAIKHGFLSSGQFARKYREMFNELPSQTLKKRMASSGPVRGNSLRAR